MPRANRSGVPGLFYSEKEEKYRIDLRYTAIVEGRRVPRRYTESLPKGIKEREAKARAKKVLMASMDGTLEGNGEEEKPRTLASALDEYLDWVRTNTPRAVKDKTKHVGLLKRLMGDPTLDELSAFLIEKFKRDRGAEMTRKYDDEAGKVIEVQVAPATINRSLACLKHFIGLAARWGWINRGRSVELCEVKLLKEPEGRVRYLTSDEEEKLLGALADENATVRRIVLVALLTGMRRAEVSLLQRTAVDWRRGLIILTKTKTGKRREIPIHEAAGAAIRAAIRDGGESAYVFCKPGTSEPFVPDSVTRVFTRVRRAVGIRDLRLHDCRHDFATKLLEAGNTPLVVAKDLLGHSTIQMTSRYQHALPQAMRTAVASLRVPGGVAAVLPQKGESEESEKAAG